MAVALLIGKHSRDPNAMVESIYHGVAPGNRTVTTIRRPSEDRNRMETTRTYGPALERGQGGQAAVLVLGGMETSLAEMEYILEAKRAKTFVPKRSEKEIAAMCRMIAIQRNERILELRKNHTVRPKKKTVQLHLPVGFKYAQTGMPGLKALVKV